MVGLFGPSEEDLERLRSTVRSLGTTSVPGLAAALSWKARKTEKLLAHELQRSGSPVVYEPGRRLVRWGPLLAPIAPPSVAPPTTPKEVLPQRAPRAPPPVLTGTGLRTLCPHCHVPLLSTGSTNLAVCPQCGRLASARSAGAATSETPAASADVSRSGGLVATPTLPLDDRRSQEMFAAYVTSKPIPCPKCRTPLRHRSVSEYSCPSCGQLVRFPGPETASARPPLPTAAAPPSGRTG